MSFMKKIILLFLLFTLVDLSRKPKRRNKRKLQTPTQLTTQVHSNYYQAIDLIMQINAVYSSISNVKFKTTDGSSPDLDIPTELIFLETTSTSTSISIIGNLQSILESRTSKIEEIFNVEVSTTSGTTLKCQVTIIYSKENSNIQFDYVDLSKDLWDLRDNLINEHNCKAK